MNVREEVKQYDDMRRRLLNIRVENNGAESEEEDKLLDEMDAAWEKLTKEERELIEKNPPLVDTDVSKTPGPVRRPAIA